MERPPFGPGAEPIVRYLVENNYLDTGSLSPPGCIRNKFTQMASVWAGG